MDVVHVDGDVSTNPRDDSEDCHCDDSDCGAVDGTDGDSCEDCYDDYRKRWRKILSLQLGIV